MYMWNTHGPILQIHTQIPPIQYRLLVTNLANFSKYSHIEKYKTQDHGAGGRPVGSLTTIYTNIPAIAITYLIWNFEMSLGYCTFMLVYHYLGI